MDNRGPAVSRHGLETHGLTGVRAVPTANQPVRLSEVVKASASPPQSTVAVDCVPNAGSKTSATPTADGVQSTSPTSTVAFRSISTS